jgi:translation initiation factor 2 subunit 2
MSTPNTNELVCACSSADEYVMCNGCKSPDTILTKENRLFFLRCEQCGCSRSVAPIKAGFVARVGRRKTTT